MKKMLSLILCLVMVMGVLVGCSDLKDGENGATIDVYLTEAIYDLDPARAYDDASLMKIIPLLFEGVTRINAKGKVEWQCQGLEGGRNGKVMVKGYNSFSFIR